jgi:hypothetical protein
MPSKGRPDGSGGYACRSLGFFFWLLTSGFWILFFHSLAIQQNTLTRGWFLADCAPADFAGFAVVKGGLAYHEKTLVQSA